MKDSLKKLAKNKLSQPSVFLALTLPSSLSIEIMRKTNQIDLSKDEMKAIADEVRHRNFCNFLVFGLGNDSIFWHRLNSGGKTVFLEESEWWLKKVQEKQSALLAYIVNYDTNRTQWRDLLHSPEQLEIQNLPPEITQQNWNVILVDAPTGSSDSCPGRMKSIFLAYQLIAPGGSIFVHDCDREIEQTYCDQFLGKHQLLDSYCQVGKLRHYKFK
ncbi:hypothetical protein [Nodularia spumigena]|jgi:glucuronoxylan 4-O-methyltransferase|uniref:Polysaccharide biosynthesis domain-containing protein n=1 Tax=Nodularia spumigena UHCC 0060 TaxID=3110300 RepID=A0ABU5UYU2_NODSP|nr:hypothetical protein [Nodularia spumigena]MEA5526343.1 hypothetical protein [Nodularia spumigena UHCC 0143]MEA5611097.1 hypothetical protein [Nodularia spumigena UHCC 0060]MEA5612878.1 hypothetical protein [Nodularia spumigena UHCC 0040]